MLMGTELKVLRAIGDRGGKATIPAIAAAARVSSAYAATICRFLDRAGYIEYSDLRGNDVCKITAKGWQGLERSKGREM